MTPRKRTKFTEDLRVVQPDPMKQMISIPTNLEITQLAKDDVQWERKVARAIVKWIGVKLKEEYESKAEIEGNPTFSADDFVIMLMRTAPDVVGRCLQGGASFYLED